MSHSVGSAVTPSENGMVGLSGDSWPPSFRSAPLGFTSRKYFEIGLESFGIIKTPSF